MLTFLLMTAVVIALSGAAMKGLTAYYRQPAAAPLHIRERKTRPVSEAQFQRYARINSALSMVMVFGVPLMFYGVLFESGPVSILRALWEGIALLMVYDFLYYFMHRYPFHEWDWLRKVHAVHHSIKNPTALDSLYQHPIENFLGLALLWVSVWLVAAVTGPISIYSFGWAFLFYSLINVAIHSGLDFKRPPLWLVGYLGRRHYKHHASMRSKNYASVTPVFDMLFGTEEA